MKIFFSGIGGSGVSAIAGFMAGKGHEISGSDRLFDVSAVHPLRKRLEENGVSIFPQTGEGMNETFDLAVFSTSVERGNPDFRKAESLSIPLKTRPEYLADIVSGYRSIAVAGTSGKSTTSGMLAFLMKRLGLEPNFIGGGKVKQFRTSGNPGNYLCGASDLLVIEACESDGTLVNYMPRHSIILNLALDHHSIDETARMFEKLVENTAEFAMVNADDKNLVSCAFRNARSYSLHNQSQYQAREVVYHPLSTRFKLNGCAYELSLPGEYNLYNAVACISFLSEFGIPGEAIATALPEFTGIERRFDIHLNNGKYLVVDDYAHNPHKIENLMTAMEKISRNICYIFQPHGYGPTRLMKEGYIETFAKGLGSSDHLMLLPIYYAGGTAAKDIASEDLLPGIRAAGKSADVIRERMSIFENFPHWDAYVVLGARDDTLSDFAEEIAARLG